MYVLGWVNSGSIDKKILKKFNGNIVDSMVESTLEYVRFLKIVILEILKFQQKLHQF